MRATEYSAAGAIRRFKFQRARVHPSLPRWWYVAALAVGFTALPLGHPNRSIDDVARLERLTPRIERAQALSPEAREAINRVVARQSVLVGSSDRSHEARRKLAIERVTSAMKAKDDGSTVGNAYRRPDAAK